MRIPGLPTPSDLLLELDLTRGVSEGPPASPLQALRSRGVPSLRDVVEGLRRAAADSSVVGLVAHLGGQSLSLAQADEVRGAVRRFAASGKPAVCWTESFGEVAPDNVNYYLATAFEEVWLSPVGDVGLVGVTATAVFVRDALGKVGVRSQFGQRHEFKTAGNLFTEQSMTEPHREMATRLAESATETIVTGVAAGRSLSAEVVRAVIEEAPVPADRAVELGLVDRLGYRADVYAAVRERVGGSEAGGGSGDGSGGGSGDGEVDLRYVERYRRSPAHAVLDKVRTPGRPVVAVVHARGPITVGRPSASPLGSGGIDPHTLGAALRAAGRDDDVKAVVLRVDSPGGSYAASDAIRDEVLRLRRTGTPVVASMGTVAGSGGYYIAMPADRVLAQPGTITGSIGVLAGKPVVAEALGRVGVTVETIPTGPFADMLSPQRPFTDEEWDRLNTWLDRAYDDFTAKAAADRGMDVERLRELARGRVWTGADAVVHGLVDRMGGLDEALDEACRLAGVDRDDVSLRTMPKPGFLEKLMPAENSESTAASVGLTGETAGGLQGVAAALGLLPSGVLSMPVTWQLR